MSSQDDQPIVTRSITQYGIRIRRYYIPEQKFLKTSVRFSKSLDDAMQTFAHEKGHFKALNRVYKYDITVFEKTDTIKVLDSVSTLPSG